MSGAPGKAEAAAVPRFYGQAYGLDKISD